MAKGLRMEFQRRWQSRIGSITLLTLTLLVTACGGGGGGSSSADAPTALTKTLNADAGNIIGIRVGQTANLDGSASTSATSSALSYLWSFTHKPQASKTAVLSDATIVNPTFVPDVAGSYMVQLIVSADGNSSLRTVALVEASVTGNLTGDVRVHTSFSSQCSDCHDGRFIDANVNPGVIIPKAGAHVGTSNMCQSCHTTFGFNEIPYVDHKEVFGNCSSCHNGVDAIGKSITHVQTTSECNVCHDTISFLELDINGNYDHTGISSGCANCHNGKTAIGINHNPDTFEKSNTDCVFCHNTTTFTEAFPNHNVILADVTANTDRCDRCHGVDATGPISGHPDVKIPDPDADCVECHSISQFSLGGVFNHRVDASVITCEVCHTEPNSINAIGMASFPSHGNTNGNDCGVCHGTSVVRSFTNTVIDHSSVTGQRCDVCHDGAGTALKKTTNHIQTQATVDCNACHTPGNFATGTFDHLPTNTGTLACSDCHNDVNSVGKIANHITTALECDSCHAADTPSTPNTFTGTLFHYNTISQNFPSTGCDTCHDGVIQTGKDISHLSTARDCSNCHTISNAAALTFTGATYDHGDPGVSINCASCHDGVTAIDKTNNGTKLNHIPAQNECSECHSTTSLGGFATSEFKMNVHPNHLNGCEGCHTATFRDVKWTSFLKTDSMNHVPTNQDCHSCHSNTNFDDKTQFTHAGITGNCESCHDGNYFTSANAMGKAQDPTPPHPDTTADCGLCHGIGNNFTDGIFEHTGIVDNCSSCHADNAPAPPTGAVTRKSSFPSHVITTQDCNVCHIPGTFKTAVFNHNQINTGCVDCHLDPNATATVKPLTGHVVTTTDCYECHNKDKFAGAKYDHNGITSNCTTCHDGVIALGKDGAHVPTGKDCGVCHQTTGMIPATFDHNTIISNCVTCHDGSLATGKNIGHTDTTLDCGSCHTIPANVIVANGPTNGWIPASFDHSGVSINTRCDSCHGVTSKPMSTDHWVTSFDCRSCHTTITFLGASWEHDGTATNNCDSCHNDTTPAPNGGARAKSGGHLNTGSQCDECHTTTAWAPTNFTHDINKATQDDYPGDHLRATNCVDCHGNTVNALYPPDATNPTSDAVKYAPFCAACHAGDFKPKDKHIGGENGTVNQNKDCAGSGCHEVNDGDF